MKTKSIRNIFALALILFSVFGCSKYEEGPCMSFRSPGSRVQGYYKVSQFLVDNVDNTSRFLDSCGCEYEYSFFTNNSNEAPSYPCEDADGLLTFICPNNSYNYIESFDTLLSPVDPYVIGLNCWRFSDDRSSIITNMGEIDTASKRIGMYPFNLSEELHSFIIVRLTESDFWLKYETGNHMYLLKLKKK